MRKIILSILMVFVIGVILWPHFGNVEHHENLIEQLHTEEVLLMSSNLGDDKSEYENQISHLKNLIEPFIAEEYKKQYFSNYYDNSYNKILNEQNKIESKNIVKYEISELIPCNDFFEKVKINNNEDFKSLKSENRMFVLIRASDEDEVIYSYIYPYVYNENDTIAIDLKTTLAFAFFSRKVTECSNNGEFDDYNWKTVMIEK